MKLVCVFKKLLGDKIIVAESSIVRQLVHHYRCFYCDDRGYSFRKLSNRTANRILADLYAVYVTELPTDMRAYCFEYKLF